MKESVLCTIMIYPQRQTIKNLHATSILVRFENKKIFSTTSEKRSSLLQRCRCSCELRSRRIGSRTRLKSKRARNCKIQQVKKLIVKYNKLKS
jgi:hypothetical protein